MEAVALKSSVYKRVAAGEDACEREEKILKFYGKVFEMDESVEFLSRIFGLLAEGKVFDTKSTDPKSLVDFKHPEELKVKLPSVKMT